MTGFLTVRHLYAGDTSKDRIMLSLAISYGCAKHITHVSAYLSHKHGPLEAARLIEEELIAQHPSLSPDEKQLINAGIERAIKRIRMLTKEST